MAAAASAVCSLQGLAQGAGAGENPATVDDLRKEIDKREAAVRALTRSLETATSEAERFKREWSELRLRDEALGIEALTGDEKRLQQKVVEAVRDLYQSEQRRQELARQLETMAGLVERLLKSGGSIGPELRAETEAALRLARAAASGRLFDGIGTAADLKAARVVRVNKSLDLAVINAGRAQGVKPGAVFELWRGGRQMGLGRAVDVRESLAGLAVERLAKGFEVAEGDEARIATTEVEATR